MDPPPFAAADWAYAAEGGKHAIFRYTGVDNIPRGRVLRVAKDRLAAAAEQSAKIDGSDASTPGRCEAFEVVDDPASLSHAFQRDIVRPLIGECYLDLPIWVRLPASLCAELYRRAMASGSIPPSRLYSWRIDGSDSLAVEVGVEVTLLRDHTRLSQQSISSNNPVLSVEIKPKAGYIASSPLVLPAHRCKYFDTRYALQQRLMQMGHIKKGWQQHAAHSEEGGAFVPSESSPLDLFSRTMERIEKALHELSRNRQNNFRAWCDGRQIFGARDAPSESECRNILNSLITGSDALDGQSDPTSALLDLITKTIAKILKRVLLLSNLLAGQQLDVIDGDGAVVVYERLVRLCGGSNVEAERLLDEAAAVGTGSIPSGQNAETGDDRGFLRSSPYAMPECTSLRELLGETERFQSSLCNRSKEGTSLDAEAMDDDASHDKCIALANNLSKQACVYLLLNWLLSLVLSDVSFFVAFQFLQEEEGAEIDEPCQTCDSGGVLQMSCAEGTTRVVRYEVKVVDCDPKPAKKLRSRREAESKFGHIVV